MNLFWKIFIAFGIATTVTLVGAVFLTFTFVGQAFDQFDIENRGDIIQQAADALEQGQVPGLRSWLEANRLPVPGVMLLIIDGNGDDLLGREVPGRFSRLLDMRPRTGLRSQGGARSQGGVRERLRRGDGPPPRDPVDIRPPQLTSNLVATDGQEYRLLFVRTRITVLGVLSWPATQFAVLALVVLAALGMALPLARYLSLPIMRLQNTSRALAAGALETRVGEPFTRRKDEVGTLARDFDIMAERIQELVTAKETLLRDVSHEFRSPLARIRMALALAERKASESSQSDLQRIERETERLDELVGEVMALARLRSQPVAKSERIALDELVSEIVDNARYEHPEAEIRYEARAVPELNGNRTQLTRAVENVVRNALNHAGSADGAAVEVNLQAAAGRVEIRVADRGPGVPEADLERIFEPFYRVDTSRDHRSGGQGIGLAIAASVLELHGGRIVARNRSGGGLEVTLELPLEAPERA